MHAVRHLALLPLAAIVLAGCGGSSHATVTAAIDRRRQRLATAHSAPSFATARARTTTAGPVDFTLAIKADVGGGTVTAEETGVAAFVGRRAHLYKQIPGSTGARGARPDRAAHLHERKRQGGARRPHGQAVDEARYATTHGQGAADAARRARPRPGSGLPRRRRRRRQARRQSGERNDTLHRRGRSGAPRPPRAAQRCGRRS